MVCEMFDFAAFRNHVSKFSLYVQTLKEKTICLFIHLDGYLLFLFLVTLT